MSERGNDTRGARRVFGREGVEFGRGLGFFDAIYGFAITLLVANIDLPGANAWRNLDTLMASGLGAQLLGFVISFAVIAVFWWSNTQLLARFTGVDGAVTVANLVVACLIVFMPFTTQGISDPVTSDFALPTALYACNVALAIAAQAAMYEVGRARGLVDAGLPRAAVRANRVDTLAKIGVFAVSIPVAYLVGAGWAQLTWLLLIPIGAITGRGIARSARAGD